jgi:type IV pilus assembly protein PilW
MIQKYLQGFTLTEMMVALLISSILMAGVLTIMSSSKRTYALQNELSELQDNARFVMDEFKHELRMAGYGGCSGPISNNPFNGSQNDQTITDSEDNPLSSFPASDVLVMNSFGEQLIRPIDEELEELTGNQITLSKRSLVPEVGNEIKISDCGGVDLYTVKGVGEAMITKVESKETGTLGLLRKYNPPIDIFMGTDTTVTYKVIGITGGFALFKCDNTDETGKNGVCDVPKELLVEGVENLQIRYGIDTDSDNVPNRYRQTLPTNNDNVVSVRITLLIRTTNKRYDLEGATDKEFQLDPELTYNPHTANGTLESGYRHRMFTTTVSVRNNLNQ